MCQETEGNSTSSEGGESGSGGTEGSALEDGGGNATTGFPTEWPDGINLEDTGIVDGELPDPGTLTSIGEVEGRLEGTSGTDYAQELLAGYPKCLSCIEGCDQDAFCLLKCPKKCPDETMVCAEDCLVESDLENCIIDCLNDLQPTTGVRLLDAEANSESWNLSCLCYSELQACLGHDATCSPLAYASITQSCTSSCTAACTLSPTVFGTTVLDDAADVDCVVDTSSYYVSPTCSNSCGGVQKVTFKVVTHPKGKGEKCEVAYVQCGDPTTAACRVPAAQDSCHNMKKDGDETDIDCMFVCVVHACAVMVLMRTCDDAFPFCFRWRHLWRPVPSRSNVL